MTVYYDKAAGGFKYHFQYKKKEYKSKKYRTRKQAEMAERRKKKELNGDILPLSRLVDLRLKDYEFHDQYQTRTKMEQMYRCRVQPFIEDKDVCLYTSQDIENMAVRLKMKKPVNPYEGEIKDQSNYSVNYTVARLGSIFNWGIRHGYCQNNPCITFEKLKYSKPEKVYWTEDQFNIAVNSLSHKQYKLRARMEVLFWTGMRRSEARGLKYTDLDLENKTLTIRRHIVEDGGHRELTKKKNNGGVMIVPIDDALAEVLKETKERDMRIDGFTEDWYILGYKKPFVLSSLAKQLDHVAEANNLPRITPHGFRHSHVSWLYSNTDLTLQETAQRIGDNVQTVQTVYAHLYKENNRRILNAINRNKKQKSETGDDGKER